MVQVTTPLLKFMAEFVLNKAQRLTFDSSSPNGILLFREVSKLIVAYGSRILSLPISTDVYALKYKGIWVSLTILSRGKCIKKHFYMDSGVTCVSSMYKNCNRQCLCFSNYICDFCDIYLKLNVTFQSNGDGKSL